MLIDDKYKIDISQKNKDPNNTSGFYRIEVEDKKIFAITLEVENAHANIIMIPPYGKASHQDMMIAYYLYKNNFNVVRFDGIDSVGLSSGNITDYRMSQLEQDMDAVINQIKKNFDLPLICVSMSLSFPVALKYASENKNIFSKMVTVVGVMDTAATIERVIERPLDEWKERRADAEKYMTIFGHDVSAQQYFDDMWENGYASVESGIQRAGKIECPLRMIMADEDQYVAIDEFNKFFKEAEADIEYIIIEGASHEMGRSLPLCKKIGETIVTYIKPDECVEVIPNITEIVKQSSVETKILNECEKQCDYVIQN